MSRPGTVSTKRDEDVDHLRTPKKLASRGSRRNARMKSEMSGVNLKLQSMTPQKPAVSYGPI